MAPPPSRMLSLLKTRSWVHALHAYSGQPAEVLSSIGRAGSQLKVRPNSDSCQADLSIEAWASQTTQQTLCGDAIVSMMKTTDLWNGHDSASGCCRDGAREGRVFVQRQVCPRAFVIFDVACQQMLQAGGVKRMT